ncbi:MAG TPA: TlpA disulfide reductase family protein [Chthonomonadaceae bacterium]|nr:TlpA disulfide reductase family protein [Chthonomonadaceae bacterium]
MRYVSLAAPSALAACATLAFAAPIQEGKAAPAFMVKTLDGKSLQLTDYRGKVVLLDFGAVDCPPCRIEMPVLQQFHKQYAKQGLVVLSLLEMKPKPTDARKMVKERGLTFPVAIDPEEKFGKLYGLESHPTAFVIDRAGRVVKVEVGYVKGDEQEIEAAFKPLLIPERGKQP